MMIIISIIGMHLFLVQGEDIKPVVLFCIAKTTKITQYVFYCLRICTEEKPMYTKSFPCK